MATDALKTYQLVAAMDWIDKFRETVVRPGPSGARPDRPRVQRARQTASDVTLEEDARRHHLQLPAGRAPTPTANVGDLLRSGKNTAVAVTLGVNRPHYVEAALWLAMGNRARTPRPRRRRCWTSWSPPSRPPSPSRPPAQEAEARPRPSQRRRRRRPRPTRPTTTALQRLIWPARRSSTRAAEEKLANEFKSQALHALQGLRRAGSSTASAASRRSRRSSTDSERVAGCCPAASRATAPC